MKIHINILFIALVCVSTVRTATYYVDATLGAEGNDGKESTPFLRIQQCASVAFAGDVCLIRAGTYRETVRPPRSGTSGNPIVFRAASANDKVIVSGLDVVNESWSLHQGSIYRTDSMTWNVYAFNKSMSVANQIFVDKKMMPEAWWPNIQPKDVTALTFGMMAQMDSVVLTSNSSATFYCSALQDSFWTDGIIIFAPGWAAQHTSCQVTGSRIGSIDLNCTTKNGVTPLTWVIGTTQFSPQGGNYFWLFGKLQALDSPGEWFYDQTTGTLYLWLEDSTDPSTKLIEAKARLNAFDLRYRPFITIEGISVFGAAINAEYMSNIILKNVEVQYAWHSMEIFFQGQNAAVTFIGTNDSQLIDSTIKYTSGFGYYVNGYRNLAKNNVFSYLSYGPVGDGVSGSIPTQSPGTTDIGSNHNEFVQNTLHTSGSTMVGIGAGQNIRYNDIWNSGIQRADLALIYGYGCNGYNGDIDHNWVHDCVSPWNLTLNYFGCSGIYLDMMCSNIRVYRNIAWGVTSSPYSAVGGPGSYNNIYAYNTGIGNGFFIQGSSLYVNVTVVNNILSSIDVRDGVTITNNFMNDPQFVDEASNDYRLRPYSPAIDGATRIGAPFDNFIPLNNIPDYGAFEMGTADSWVPGAQVRESDVTSLTVTCTSTSGGNLDCNIEGLPEGRKLPADFELNVGPAGGSSPTGTPSTCRTQFDYTNNSGIGVCNGIIPASGTTSGTSLSIYVKQNSSATWTDTGLTTTLTSFSISSVQPTNGVAGTLISIYGNAFPYTNDESTQAKYSATVTVTGPSNNDLYKYPVLLQLDTASLIAAGKMQSDCKDMSFSDTYGTIPYWIEQETCNTATTAVWVRVSYIPKAKTTTFNMSYGNPSITEAQSDPENAFMFFEDFSDNDVNGVLTSSSYFTTSVQDGQLRFTGSSNTTNRYSWAYFFSFDRTTALNFRKGSFAIDCEVAVISAPANWYLSPSGATTALIGALVNNKKPIVQQNGTWVQIGQSSISGATFSTLKKYSIGYFGSDSYEVRWFEDNNFTQSITQVISVAQSSAASAFWFSPQDVFNNFDVRLDNIRGRPFNFPEPTNQIGAETESSTYLTVSVGDKSCLNPVVVSSGVIQCTVDTLSNSAMGTWVDVTVTTNQGSLTLPSSFYYGEISSPGYSNNPNTGGNSASSATVSTFCYSLVSLGVISLVNLLL